MNTQLPNCIPATLHCTPIEPCPTINPPCHGGQQAQAQQTAATVCTQLGCQTHVYATNCPPATVCAQPTTLCPPPQQAGGAQQQVQFTPATVCTQLGCQTHVYATNCPPATVCAQPTTLCPPPQQAWGGQQQVQQFTPATVCTQLGCHQPQQAGPTPTATFFPGCPTQQCPAPAPQQQVGNWPTPQTRCFVCDPPHYAQQQPAPAVNTQLPQCQPYTTLCIWTVNQGACHTQQCPPQQGGGGGCLPMTIGPVRTPLCPWG